MKSIITLVGSLLEIVFIFEFSTLCISTMHTRRIFPQLKCSKAVIVLILLKIMVPILIYFIFQKETRKIPVSRVFSHPYR
jgi:hypothetical protein